MTRVAHVITGLRTGGAELALSRLVAAAPPGTEPVVVSLTPGGEVAQVIRDQGVPVHELPMRSPRDLPRGAPALRRLLRHLRPDVVQTWMHHADLLGGVAARSLRLPVVWGLRMGLVADAPERPTTRAVARGNAALSRVVPHAVVACSYAVAEQYGRSGYDTRRMVVIPNGYDTTTPPPDRSLRAGLGIPEDAVVIGRVARWHGWKDYPTFLRAAGPLLAEHPSLHLVLVGDGVDRGNAELAALVAATPEPARVHLLGRQADMPAVYGTLDVLCSSSASGEGFPNVLAEAMLAGVAVVTTDVGESARIAGDTGLVVPPRDVEALRAALGTAARRSEDDRAALGRAARASVVARYSVERMAAAYADLHDAVAAGREPAAGWGWFD